MLTQGEQTIMKKKKLKYKQNNLQNKQQLCMIMKLTRNHRNEHKPRKQVA